MMIFDLNAFDNPTAPNTYLNYNPLINILAVKICSVTEAVLNIHNRWGPAALSDTINTRFNNYLIDFKAFCSVLRH